MFVSLLYMRNSFWTTFALFRFEKFCCSSLQRLFFYSDNIIWCISMLLQLQHVESVQSCPLLRENLATLMPALFFCAFCSSYCSCIIVPLLFFSPKLVFFLANGRQWVTSDHFVAPANFLVMLNGAFHRNALHFVLELLWNTARLHVMIRAQTRKIS